MVKDNLCVQATDLRVPSMSTYEYFYVEAVRPGGEGLMRIQNVIFIPPQGPTPALPEGPYVRSEAHELDEIHDRCEGGAGQYQHAL